MYIYFAKLWKILEALGRFDGKRHIGLTESTEIDGDVGRSLEHVTTCVLQHSTRRVHRY